MPDTNPDAVKLLSDDALREIEAAQVKRRESLAFHQGECPGLPSPPYIEEIDALCATVRALRVENKKLKDRLAEQRTQNRHLWEANKEIVSTNTALREQLAQSRAENERLASQLKQWQEEKDTKAGYL